MRFFSPPGHGQPLIWVAAAMLMCGSTPQAHATEPAAHPLIAIIIDDLGNTLEEGQRAADLPGPVACAILPHTLYSLALARLAHAHGKEVLLHLPMQSISDAPPGAGAITLDMTERQIKDTVRADVAAVPWATGVNNHEGSLITMHPGDMAWIMQALHSLGQFFYVDSYTSADSVAYQVALENGVPAARRNVFLDDVDTTAAVASEFQRLLGIARDQGYALAIGHPRPATLAVLEQELPALAAQHVELVPVSTIVKLQQQHPLPWPAYLSRWLPASGRMPR